MNKCRNCNGPIEPDNMREHYCDACTLEENVNSAIWYDKQNRGLPLVVNPKAVGAINLYLNTYLKERPFFYKERWIDEYYKRACWVVNEEEAKSFIKNSPYPSIKKKNCTQVFGPDWETVCCGEIRQDKGE